jgi:hypothetical protein
VHDLASVLTLQLLVTGQGLQYLGRHLRDIKVTVDPGLNSTFSMVRDRTNEMVSHTMILKGVSLFLLGMVDATSWGLSLVSTLASKTGKASLSVGSSNNLARISCEIEEKDLVFTSAWIVGFLVGVLLVTLELGEGNVFPAVKGSGLLFLINPLIPLVLVGELFTAGATRQMLRGSRSNVFPHDARKLSSSSSSESDSTIFLLDLVLFSLRGTFTASGLRLRAAITSFSATALPRFDLVAFFAGVSIATAKLSSSALLLAVDLDTSSSSTSVFSSLFFDSSSLLV